MASPVQARWYRLPLRSKFSEWLSNNPRRVATAQQWLGMLNNLQCVRKEEIERAGIIDVLTDHYPPHARVQVHYAVMAQGYMVIADGKALETGKRETREFKTLDAAAKLLFKPGVADFAVKLRTT